ncbi:DUF503 domain-containing protein [Sporolactobacillus sp. Y61]|jgi:uncharacterized protein YlxP (DUF503 family)|uniref:DUF503 domain-containing protein n=1 Tax=Sporolactobacillus sp. Y61 TaxID=3160863 RepID=A0AAU8ICY6_9BACL|nr:DUF503 domain-containing protein [Sporolactobacillus sp. THM19-2]RYL92987.1 DUF503 family protein [Sporolactobacillus sp. THM19-2]
MIIGLVQCDCLIQESHSLKDKRSVIQSILRKATNGHNIAASETGYQNVWQRTALAFVSVGTSKVHVEQELNRALRLIDSRTDIERTDTTYEWF